MEYDKYPMLHSKSILKEKNEHILEVSQRLLFLEGLLEIPTFLKYMHFRSTTLLHITAIL